VVNKREIALLCFVIFLGGIGISLRAYWLESRSGIINIHATSPDEARLRLMDVCQARGSIEAFPGRMNEMASRCSCFSSFFFWQLSADEIDQLTAIGRIPASARQKKLASETRCGVVLPA
jgi:hypothetical protein